MHYFSPSASGPVRATTLGHRLLDVLTRRVDAPSDADDRKPGEKIRC